MNRRAILRSLAAVPSRTVLAMTIPDHLATACAPNPVFVLIEQHKAAWAAWAAIVDTTASHDEIGDAIGVADEVMAVLCATEPATVPGVLALIDYVEFHRSRDQGAVGVDVFPAMAAICRKLIAIGGAA